MITPEIYIKADNAFKNLDAVCEAKKLTPTEAAPLMYVRDKLALWLRRHREAVKNG